VADSSRVDVCNRAHELIGVHLDEQWWDHLFCLDKVLHNSVDGLCDVFHHDIQVNFIRVVSIRVKRIQHSYAIWVCQVLHDRQLSVFVPLILEYLLYSYKLPGFCDSCFENNTERAISNDLLNVVSESLRALYESEQATYILATIDSSLYLLIRVHGKPERNEGN